MHELCGVWKSWWKWLLVVIIKLYSAFRMERHVRSVVQKYVSRAHNYIPQIMWDVIIWSCPWYLLPAQHSSLISPSKIISLRGVVFPRSSWRRHQMETFSVLLAICAGNSPVSSEFPAQRPVTRSFMFSLICARINDWVNNCEAGDLMRISPIMTSQ